jgi:hypothetical protein
LAPLVGGLSSLQAAVICLPLEPLSPLLPLSLLLPQATRLASPSEIATPESEARRMNVDTVPPDCFGLTTREAELMSAVC